MIILHSNLTIVPNINEKLFPHTNFYDRFTNFLVTSLHPADTRESVLILQGIKRQNNYSTDRGNYQDLLQNKCMEESKGVNLLIK